LREYFVNYQVNQAAFMSLLRALCTLKALDILVTSLRSMVA